MIMISITSSPEKHDHYVKMLARTLSYATVIEPVLIGTLNGERRLIIFPFNTTLNTISMIASMDGYDDILIPDKDEKHMNSIYTANVAPPYAMFKKLNCDFLDIITIFICDFSRGTCITIDIGPRRNCGRDYIEYTNFGYIDNNPCILVSLDNENVNVHDLEFNMICEFDSDMNYQGLKNPVSVWNIDVETRQLVLRPAGSDYSNYVPKFVLKIDAVKEIFNICYAGCNLERQLEYLENRDELIMNVVLMFDLTQYNCAIFDCSADFDDLFILMIFSPSGRKLAQYCFVSYVNYIRHTSMYLWNGRLYICGMGVVAKLLRF